VKLVVDAKAHKIAVEARVEAREDTRDVQQRVAPAKCDATSGIGARCIIALSLSF